MVLILNKVSNMVNISIFNSRTSTSFGDVPFRTDVTQYNAYSCTIYYNQMQNTIKNFNKSIPTF
ncbi:hypothetical protein VAZ01S_048_00110 [Vibrio azureus NBRC 104587]|uniref:Uncharacterized protein n=1 Tax=Vibrio azureus NBRC 104587 TaxID=1219077 RepID=U3C5A9_9VIBR|nr:hypothetical protein VAZ01S_048_00110 [Vibrio azureus NBRC 104587]